MAFNFLPKEEQFFKLFEAQAAYNTAAVKAFKELVNNWDSRSPAFERIREIEHEADITTHEIYDKLNRTFITPFDREDIHALASEMDDIVDLVQSLCNRMRLYHIGHSTPDLAQLVDILDQATDAIRKAVAELQDQAKTRRVLDYCIEINRLENTGDHARDLALSKLFEGQPDPIEVIKWKEIYELVEAAIDKCEDIANTIETILVKQA
jgi:predicted phosphate transport protein (TIGR00153 family)